MFAIEHAIAPCWHQHQGAGVGALCDSRTPSGRCSAAHRACDASGHASCRSSAGIRPIGEPPIPQGSGGVQGCMTAGWVRSVTAPQDPTRQKLKHCTRLAVVECGEQVGRATMG